MPEHRPAWRSFAKRLAANGYRCLIPRQRGFSPAARPRRVRDYRISQLGDDIEALIDASGAARVHLVGHDWGGKIVWRVAQQCPAKLLTLTALSTPHPAAYLKSLVTSRQALASMYIPLVQIPWLPEQLIARVLRKHGDPDAGVINKMLTDEDVASLSEPGALTAAFNYYRAMPLTDPRADCRKVTVPTLHIWSNRDLTFAEKGAQVCGDYVTGEYRFEVLDGVSHWILDEAPEEVTGLVLDWFATHPAVVQPR